jgi:lipopolysaccharide export LptBFGC system permease protein LptF
MQNEKSNKVARIMSPKHQRSMFRDAASEASKDKTVLLLAQDNVRYQRRAAIWAMIAGGCALAALCLLAVVVDYARTRCL